MGILEAEAGRREWELGKLSSSSLLLPLLPVLLVVEFMGNIGVEACLDWFGRQRQTVVAACFWPLTQFEPALLPSLDLLHWQRWKSVFVSSQPVARVSIFKLEILSMWSLANLKLTITSSFRQTPGGTLLSLKLGKMLKCLIHTQRCEFKLSPRLRQQFFHQFHPWFPFLGTVSLWKTCKQRLSV